MQVHEHKPMQYPELVVDYQPRDQFVGFHDRLERFACIVTHRRAGKTVACIHDLQRAAINLQRTRPRLAYLSPFLKQSKAVAWDYLRGAMAPLRAIGASVHESELRVDYINGGQVRLYGADNPDALRGIYLDGVVLDEYADMDPRVWSEIIRPALADRAGWAVFIGTPKGRNAFFELWRRAQSEANWFSLMLKASDTGLIPASELALAKRDLSEEQYAQEFECSFEAAVVGAYFGKLMARADAERRIAAVPYEPAAPVWTSWDLGVRDATAIWFAQMIGREIRIIDYYEASGIDLGHYVRELNARPYVYAGHIVPHDGTDRADKPVTAAYMASQPRGSPQVATPVATCARVAPRPRQRTGGRFCGGARHVGGGARSLGPFQMSALGWQDHRRYATIRRTRITAATKCSPLNCKQS
jgi:hypothetical protein